MPLAIANAIDFSFLPLCSLFPLSMDRTSPACIPPFIHRMFPSICIAVRTWASYGEPGAAQPMGLITTSGIISLLRDERGGSCRRSVHGLQLQKSQSKTAENWLDKCRKCLEINTPWRRSQAFRNHFKAISD